MAAARVRVALPWLQAALAEASRATSLPAMHALRWLGGRGRLHVRRTPRLARMVARARRRRGSAGALARRAGARAGSTDWTAAGPGSWCVAQPVHLAAGLDHLRLAPLAQAALDGGRTPANSAHS